MISRIPIRTAINGIVVFNEVIHPHFQHGCYQINNYAERGSDGANRAVHNKHNAEMDHINSELLSNRPKYWCHNNHGSRAIHKHADNKENGSYQQKEYGGDLLRIHEPGAEFLGMLSHVR